MKKLLAAIVCAVVVAGIGLRAQAQNFTVLNKTGFTIVALYVSEVDDKKWGEDILGRDVLEDGDELPIRFKGYGDDVCDFDIRIDDDKDNQWTVEDIDLCKIHKLTFTKKGNKVLWEAR